MKVLFIGDIVGEAGRDMVRDFLPKLKAAKSIDLVIANTENMAGGFGVTPQTVQEMSQAGVQLMSGGNHSFDKKEALGLYDDDPYLIRPANYPEGTPGRGWTTYALSAGVKVALVNLMGRTFMEPLDCPFKKAEKLLPEIQAITNIIIFDFHGEATSEKMAFGWFMNGRASAVVGTHTHIQTADERVLDKGTAYISDLGMTGPYDSVIGVKKEIVIERFVERRGKKFETASQDPWLCGVIIDIDTTTGKSNSIERVRIERKDPKTHP
ncbi:MAG: TIGR00282 family metallophosphoesterase [Bdellovibrionota bacterium]